MKKLMKINNQGRTVATFKSCSCTCLCYCSSTPSSTLSKSGGKTGALITYNK